jgi:predicted DNA-binding transcriptional regulator AlpA
MQKEMLMDAEFFDQRDLSRRWRISVRTLEKWRTNRTGPRFIKVGGRVRYRRADVEAWEERRASVEAGPVEDDVDEPSGAS